MAKKVHTRQATSALNAKTVGTRDAASLEEIISSSDNQRLVNSLERNRNAGELRNVARSHSKALSIEESFARLGIADSNKVARTTESSQSSFHGLHNAVVDNHQSSTRVNNRT